MAKSKKKIIVIITLAIIGIAAISVGVVKAVNSDNGSQIPVTAAKVEEESIESSIISDGVIKAKEQQYVVCNLPYSIKKIQVKEGDRVSKGTVLALLDTEDLEYNIKTAETNLKIEKKRLEELLKNPRAFQSQKNYENAKLAYENAEKKYEASLKLYEAGAISKAQLDNDLVAFNTAENNYELAKKELENAENGVDVFSQLNKIELEELNLERQKEKLEKSKIKSPIDGTIVASNAKVGVMANTLSPMFVLENLNRLEIEVFISEYDINKIRIGQEVSITGEAFKGHEFKGKVSYIAPTATVVNTNSGRETNVKIKIDIIDPTEVLKPGFSADISINTAKKDSALVVPYEALYHKKDGTTIVYKIDKDSKVVEIPVVIGIEGDLKVEIQSDSIEAGDNVILNPTESIKPGMQVNIINKGEIR